MNEAQRLLYQPKWRIIDQTQIQTQNQTRKFDALHSFGIDDTLCASVGSGLAPATARAWVHHQTVVLGIQDTKLPFLTNGMQYLTKQGYQVIVRNSGGLAVLLDNGVLNLTLVFQENGRRIEINQAYEAMWLVIKRMFTDFPYLIEAREIADSYCPGSYDLSINGKKFAGISQRRLRNGVAVQIYLCVNGSGAERAELIKGFYQIAKQGETTKLVYPEVNPEVMSSLSELVKQQLTVPVTVDRFLKVLKETAGEIYYGQLINEEQPLFSHYYQRVSDRNEKALSGY